MNSSEIPWLSELEVDNLISMDHSAGLLDSFDEELAAAFTQDLKNHLSNSSSSSNLMNVPSSNSITFFDTSPGVTDHHENVNHQTPPENYSDFTIINNSVVNSDQASSAPILLSFGNMNHSENPQQVNSWSLNPEHESIFSEVLKSRGTPYDVNAEEGSRIAQPTRKKARIRPPSQTYDHIIAERKRREQLSQLFIALSAIVPGLKKMDKSSVLGDAIKYLKQLRERVETLEEQAAKQTMESTVLIRKSHVVEDEGSSDEKSASSDEVMMLPEIEARVCNNNILLRIHCEKQKGLLVNLMSMVDNFNLIVVSTNVVPFGNSALDITIIAEMDKESNLNGKEMVTAVRAALQSAE